MAKPKQNVKLLRRGARVRNCVSWPEAPLLLAGEERTRKRPKEEPKEAEGTSEVRARRAHGRGTSSRATRKWRGPQEKGREGLSWDSLEEPSSLKEQSRARVGACRMTSSYARLVGRAKGAMRGRKDSEQKEWWWTISV